MKLSFSNIAWDAEKDLFMYAKLKGLGYSALEIAPTRILQIDPYENPEAARQWASGLKESYGLGISSMQSIWYGRKELLFGSEEERGSLLTYTKKAIDFAAVIGCNNLVLGCPENRVLLENSRLSDGVNFFRAVGDYAAEKGTVIGMEANPPIYNTNYINTTKGAIELIQAVASPGFKLNLDVGTMICNGEEVALLEESMEMIHHVHISEPGLKPLQRRKLHRELGYLLKTSGYKGFVSVEMGFQKDFSFVEEAAVYVKEMFS